MSIIPCGRRWRPSLLGCAVLLAVVASGRPRDLDAQAAAPLSLAEVRALARRASPELTAAREAVVAARGRERQATMRLNPTVGVMREQASGGGQSTAQHIALLEQPIEPGGLRGARRGVATARREAAEAMLGVAESRLDFESARAYAAALAANRRAALAERATAAFTDALKVSERRLAAGDISAYAHRRLKLEAALHATLRAEAMLARRAARVALASLVATASDSIGMLDGPLTDSLPTRASEFLNDSLAAQALRARGELRAAVAEARAAQAEARLATSERTPVPVISGGVKSERVSATGGGTEGLRGLVVGIALPLPLWDRRAGAIEAADAEARRRTAEVEGQRRRIVKEVADAHDALRAAEAQVAMLAPQLGAESTAALRAAGVAYAEGEITLSEWLDAVRAYRDAEAAFATLQSEALTRRAALERAVGGPLADAAAAGAGR